jgi:hypothetical protein
MWQTRNTYRSLMGKLSGVGRINIKMYLKKQVVRVKGG